MLGFSALSEAPFSSDVEVQASLPVLSIPVGAFGSSALGVYAIGRATDTTDAYDLQYVENGYWEGGYAVGDNSGVIAATADVDLPTLTITSLATDEAASGNVYVEVSASDAYTVAPSVAATADAAVAIAAIEGASITSSEAVANGTANAEEVAQSVLALTPAEALATGAAEATYADLIDVGISPAEVSVDATSEASADLAQVLLTANTASAAGTATFIANQEISITAQSPAPTTNGNAQTISAFTTDLVVSAPTVAAGISAAVSTELNNQLVATKPLAKSVASTSTATSTGIEVQTYSSADLYREITIPDGETLAAALWGISRAVTVRTVYGTGPIQTTYARIYDITEDGSLSFVAEHELVATTGTNRVYEFSLSNVFVLDTNGGDPEVFAFIPYGGSSQGAVLRKVIATGQGSVTTFDNTLSTTPFNRLSWLNEPEVRFAKIAPYNYGLIVAMPNDVANQNGAHRVWYHAADIQFASQLLTEFGDRVTASLFIDYVNNDTYHPQNAAYYAQFMPDSNNVDAVVSPGYVVKGYNTQPSGTEFRYTEPDVWARSYAVRDTAFAQRIEQYTTEFQHTAELPLAVYEPTSALSISSAASADSATVSTVAPDATTGAGYGAVNEVTIGTLTVTPPEAVVSYSANTGAFALQIARLFAPASYETVIEVPLPTPVVQATSPEPSASAAANTEASGATAAVAAPEPTVTYTSVATADLPTLDLLAPASTEQADANRNVVAVTFPPTVGTVDAIGQGTAAASADNLGVELAAPAPGLQYSAQVYIDVSTIDVVAPSVEAGAIVIAEIGLPVLTTIAPEVAVSYPASASAELDVITLSAAEAGLEISSTAATAGTETTVTAPNPGAGISTASSALELQADSPVVGTLIESITRSELPALSVTTPSVSGAVSVEADAALPDAYTSPASPTVSIDTTVDLSQVAFTAPNVAATTVEEAVAGGAFSGVITIIPPAIEITLTSNAHADAPGVVVYVDTVQTAVSVETYIELPTLQMWQDDRSQRYILVIADANTATDIATATITGIEAKGQIDALEEVQLPVVYIGYPGHETAADANTTADLIEGAIVVANPTDAHVEATANTGVLAPVSLVVEAPAATAIVNIDAESNLGQAYLETAVNARPAVVNVNCGNDALIISSDTSVVESASFLSPGEYFVLCQPPVDQGNDTALGARYGVQLSLGSTQTSDGKRAYRAQANLYRLDYNEAGYFNYTLVDTAYNSTPYSYQVQSQDGQEPLFSFDAATGTGYLLKLAGYRSARGAAYNWGGLRFTFDINSETIESGGDYFHYNSSYNSVVIDSAYTDAFDPIDYTRTLNRKLLWIQDASNSNKYRRFYISASGSFSHSNTTYTIPTEGKILENVGLTAYWDDIPLPTSAAQFFKHLDRTVEVKAPCATLWTPLAQRTDYNGLAIATGADLAITQTLRSAATVSHVVNTALPTLTLAAPASDYDGNGEAATKGIGGLSVTAVANELTVSNNCQTPFTQSLNIEAPRVTAVGGISSPIFPELEIISVDAAVSIETFAAIDTLTIYAPALDFDADGSAYATAPTITVAAPTADAGVYVEITDVPPLVVSPESLPFAAQGDTGLLVEVRDPISAQIVAPQPGVIISQSIAVDLYAQLDVVAPSVFAFQAQAIPDFVILVENETRFIEVAEEIRTAEVGPETRIIEVA